MTIRRQPDDFVVRERLTERMLASVLSSSIGSARSVPFALYELDKTALSTPEATMAEYSPSEWPATACGATPVCAIQTR